MRIGPILGLILLPACSLADGTVASDGGEDWEAPDAAGGVGLDGGPAGAADASASTLDASPPPMGVDAGSADPESRTDDACFNGVDDDANSLTDCDDLSCGAAPYCCVGSTAAGCCTGAGASLTLGFGSCAGADPAACGAGLTTFGAPAPRIEGGAFVPNGDAIDDSGMILGAPVDPTRERVILRATIAADLDGCTDCLDALAIGLAEAPSGNVRVVPDVALMVRASRRDYALVVAGEPVDTAALPDASPHAYALSVEPSGDVSLAVDGAVVMRARAPLRSARVPLLFGRTHNRDGAHLPARASDVSVQTLGCDIPSALTRHGAVVPFAGVDWGSRVVNNPSIAIDGDDHLVAFTLNQNVHLARRAADGTFRLAGSGAVEIPAVAADVNETLRDPELIADPARWVLYVTRTPTDGPSRIARAVGGDGFAETFDAPVDVTLPPDATVAEAPAVIDDGGTRWLAVRTAHEGRSVIALLAASDAEGAVFAWARGDLASSILVAPHDDLTRFDHDEVSDPALLVDDVGLLRLFYAGRRGTRWGIGLRVSGDRVVWREPSGAPILAGSGGGHDRLWARHPSAVLDGRALTLLYTASDGVGLDVGMATGWAP